ncbi:hypothetical protein COT97_00650 [Candidatus Falkowbacteria bacterium CG10_big_fil_rev_8_21_14_0_10_39_11]|uniref:HD domain-containing protein n=1 Tax=Candidatus Falkowbacteria bacterium CG10_big_fil_rev_8_21_14_0_10_39_11 TaxID=1974565 RepID=A0A2H0V865_9BACT|nr:MAG: hypothetical protein COT97_00650 [Candidatus Falkowbacteria bacterium CG10_big_fil_rev_8_21_14_0_10_39_11]
MDSNLQQFKDHVIKAAANPDFIHHAWFVDYHLIIVEQIALELCKKHPDADKNIILLLVWLHDYGKILDINHEHKTTLSMGPKVLTEFGFNNEVIKLALDYIRQIDAHAEMDLSKASIEVKIVSSADAAAHLIGPFYQVYLHENPNKSLKDLMSSNKLKVKKEWSEKIVLPEIKKAFLDRYNLILEQNGDLPNNYLTK